MYTVLYNSQTAKSLQNLEVFSFVTCVCISEFLHLVEKLSRAYRFLKEPTTFWRRNTGIFHVLPSYIINYFVLHNTIIFTLSFLNYGCLGKIYIYGDNHILILAKERMRHFALTTSSIIQLQKTVLVVLKTLQIF